MIFILVLGSAPTIASAHDFWIEPSSFHPAVGETVSVSLRVGQDFIGDPVPRSAPLIAAFVVRDSKKEWPVNGFANQDPAGLLRIDREGVATIAYRSTANPLDLPAEKFNEFLRIEQLDAIAAERVRRSETNKPDREHFFRFAKALLLTGTDNAAPFERTAGFRYDIVPASDPWSNHPLRVRVYLDGKPAAGALVKAIHRDDPDAHLAVRTDARGFATLALPKAGVWLVESVAMVEAPPSEGVDWESLWASVTFER